MKRWADGFHQQLQSLWQIENMLVMSMPQMIEVANNFGLKKALAHHFAETQQHRTAIEAIAKQLDIEVKTDEQDPRLQEILQQVDNLQSGFNSNEMDAAIISAALEVEAYEISVYQPAAKAAKELGYEGISKRLFLTFEEERQADNMLKFLETQLVSGSAEIGQLVHEQHEKVT